MSEMVPPFVVHNKMHVMTKMTASVNVVSLGTIFATFADVRHV